MILHGNREQHKSFTSLYMSVKWTWIDKWYRKMSIWYIHRVAKRNFSVVHISISHFTAFYSVILSPIVQYSWLYWLCEFYNIIFEYLNGEFTDIFISHALGSCTWSKYHFYKHVLLFITFYLVFIIFIHNLMVIKTFNREYKKKPFNGTLQPYGKMNNKMRV